jgi:hypothetical protein
VAYGVAVRQVVGVVALLYAVLVVAMGTKQLLTGPAVLLYAAVAVLVPIAVIAADRLARGGDHLAELVAQGGLGVIAGMWALPSSSGLVSVLAAVVGTWSVFRARHRWSAALAFVAGVLIGLGVLALSFVR